VTAPADRPFAPELAALADAGVWDPADPVEGDARRQALEYFLGNGATVDELVTACREERLNTFEVDRLVLTKGELTSGELADRLGIDLDTLERVVRTAGLPVPPPDERAFTQRDVDNIGALLPALELFPVDVALQLLRVISSSLARIADAGVGAYLQVVERRIVESGGTVLDHAHANRDAVIALAHATRAMEGLLTRHLAVAIERSRRARLDPDDYDTLHLAVGFVDLVGYTSLSGRLRPAELSRLIGHFEEVAFDALSSRDGRVVKLIGDEVMYVTVGAADAVAVALELVAAFGSDERTTPRGGVAVGELMLQEGDYYGPVVNLASRIADTAVPSEILVSDEVHDELVGNGSPFAFEGAGRRQLKGFAEPVRLWSVTGP
jgi:adenylate cyclase